MEYEPPLIPARCVGCPRIFPALQAWQIAEAEYALFNQATDTTGHVNEAMSEHADQLRERWRLTEAQLSDVAAYTIGCAGVKLAQVRLGDEYVLSAECRSPLQT